MKLSIVYSRACIGIKAPLVTIESHITYGLPSWSMVGLPETAVKESKERVRSAIINSGFDFPMNRITINMAPADLPKSSGRFDLPIALGILAASSQIPDSIFTEYEFAGELSLAGEILPIRGCLPLAIGARESQRKLIVPQENIVEATLPGDNLVYGASHLKQVCAHIHQTKTLHLASTSTFQDAQATKGANQLDLADIKGQQHAKQALCIAAAGGHSMLMHGPPGTGKTMLANRLLPLLPPLSLAESLDVAAIYSIRKKIVKKYLARDHFVVLITLQARSQWLEEAEILRLAKYHWLIMEFYF